MPPLCNHDGVLLFHFVVLSNQLSLCFLPELGLEVAFLLVAADLLHQLVSVLIGKLASFVVISLDLVLLTEVVPGILFREDFVKVLVLHLLVFGLIGHVLCIFQVLCLYLVLLGDASCHPLHVVVVVPHEWSHCKVKTLDDSILILVHVDLM